MRPSQHVDGGRLWQRLMELAAFGARPDGGVDRQALTADEIAARAALVEWGRAVNLQPFTDPAANLFLRLNGREPDLAPVLTGSHIDSQPTGGKFDGAFGVLAGLEAVQAIVASGQRPRRSIEVVAWTNEEGCRFSPGMTGSELYAGTKTMAALAGLRDPAGVTLAEAIGDVLAADRDVAQRPFGREIAALVEAHIEQGPLLEREGVPVGVVTAIQGTRRYRVAVSGMAAHAGTTERADRRDALLAAVRMVSAMERATAEPADVKFTVGLFQVLPNVPSVVPESVVFSIDVRHPCDTVVDRIDAAVAEIVAQAAAPCTATLRQIQHNSTVTFSAEIRATLADAAEALGIPHRDIASAAGHDARSLAGFCPTGMLFVPCRDGLSHHPAEWSDPADLLAGARVLTDTLWGLAA
ncbi:MAG: M20 family metallo-hydrolase [Acetobacteraceae bacterium]|nr:M20 family metallo-hydrolase [Acetobacteraceae bacterium]